MHRIHAAHRRLQSTLLTLTDDDLGRPSLLPDWSVGHVIAHIALNAEGFVNVASGLRLGRVGEMYPGGIEARGAAIERCATRSAEALRSQVEWSSELFETRWAMLTEEQLEGIGCLTLGLMEYPAKDVPMRRLREVEIHHADAGLASFTYEDWSDAYVDADLPNQLGGIADRLGRSIAFVDEDGRVHLCGEHAIDIEPIATTRRQLLAWAFNRVQPDGFPEIGSWQSPPPQR